MSKQKEAFDLFQQGRRPGDLELKALGLTAKTLYNYFQLWKKFVVSKQPAKQEGKQHIEVPPGLPTGDNINITQAANLQGTGVVCPVTPIIIAAIKAALVQWRWPWDMSLEDFVDTALYHHYKDKGIILQDYGYKIEE